MHLARLGRFAGLDARPARRVPAAGQAGCQPAIQPTASRRYDQINQATLRPTADALLAIRFRGSRREFVRGILCPKSVRRVEGGGGAIRGRSADRRKGGTE